MMETGRTYKRGLIFPDLVRKTLITPAQIITMFATPVTLVPATPGFATIPYFIHGFKTAGAYGLNGNTNILLRWGPTTPVIAGFFNGAGFIDAAGSVVGINLSAGSSTGFAYCAVGQAAGRLDQAIQIRPDTAELTGAGGSLEITVTYTLVPSAAAIS